MLQLTSDTNGSINKDPFCIATSTSSPYTPLISYYDRNSVSTDGIDKFFLYHKPIIQKDNTYSSFRIGTFLHHLNTYNYFTYMPINAEKTVGIYVAKGCIYDDNKNLLLMLSYDSKKDNVNLNNSYREQSATKEQSKDFTLFISTELLTNPVYNVFYKKLEKSYIQDAYASDLPVIFTTSNKIETLHYSNDFKVEFNQVADFENHIQHVVGQFPSFDNDAFNTINPGVGRRIIQPVINEEVVPIRRRGLMEQMQERGMSISNSSHNIFPRESLEQRLRQEIINEIGISNRYIGGIDPVSTIEPPVSIVSYLGSDWDRRQIEGQITLVDDTVEEVTDSEAQVDWLE